MGVIIKRVGVDINCSVQESRSKLLWQGLQDSRGVSQLGLGNKNTLVMQLPADSAPQVPTGSFWLLRLPRQ